MATIFQGIEGAHEIRFQCANTILAILARRSWTGKIVNPFEGDIRQSVTDITTDEVKIGISGSRDQISLISGFKVIKTPHFMPKLKELVTKVRADETGTARH